MTEDSDSEEERNRKKANPNVLARFCCCCCRKKHQKCCTKNCEWKGFQILCAATWAVIVIALILLLVFLAQSCNDFVRVLPSIIGNSLGTWICIFVYICFSILSAILFLIFTKFQCGSGCCCLYCVLWFIIHIGLGAFTIVSIYKTPVPTWMDLFSSYNAKKGKPPKWFSYIQEDEFCCLNGTNGQLGIDKTYVQRCADEYSNGTYSAHVTTCISVVRGIYDQCLGFATASSHMLLVLGVIPFTVYCCTYQQVKKYNSLTPGEEQEDDESTPDEGSPEEDKDSTVDKGLEETKATDTENDEERKENAEKGKRQFGDENSNNVEDNASKGSKNSS